MINDLMFDLFLPDSLDLMKSSFYSMKVFKYILIGLAVIVLAVITVNIFAPSKMQIEKSIIINAPASAVYEEVADFHNWGKWDPWKKADPNMTGEYSGPDKGEGATWTWQSETQGNGVQSIVEARSNEYIKTSLEFDSWEGTNYAEWFFEDSEQGVKVSWTIDGAESPFMFRFFNLMMEPMVGGMYDQGLASLKELAESKPAETPEPEETEVVEMDSDSSDTDADMSESEEMESASE